LGAAVPGPHSRAARWTADGRDGPRSRVVLVKARVQPKLSDGHHRQSSRRGHSTTRRRRLERAPGSLRRRRVLLPAGSAQRELTGGADGRVPCSPGASDGCVGAEWRTERDGPCLTIFRPERVRAAGLIPSGFHVAPVLAREPGGHLPGCVSLRRGPSAGK
jgi:hypothetical protein